MIRKTAFSRTIQTHGSWTAASGRLRPAPIQRVHVQGFLGRRIDANVASLLCGLDSPIPEAFEAFARGETPSKRAGSRLSDLFKWLEGAAYALAYRHEPALSEALARIAELIARAMPGIENHKSYRSHYVAGHFFQAAVAHYNLTGERLLLDLACRWADWLAETDRSAEPETRIVKGSPDRANDYTHPCLELGLILLARTTGERRFLDFAVTLIDRYYIAEKVADLICGSHRRHAVCVEYLLTACAELYFETGDAALLERLYTLWSELVTTRLYLAGGIGYEEIIPEVPYDLPQVMPPHQHKDIAETCASVGLMMLSWRLHAASGDARIFDVIETTLYNHFLGGLSLDHKGIFYYNPLRMVGSHPKKDLDKDAYRRTVLPDVHQTSCCFPNAWRFLAALPEYLFSTGDEGVYVNLYTSSTFEHTLPGGASLSLSVETEYPFDGAVRLAVKVSEPARFALKLRIPSWARGASVAVDGATKAHSLRSGYLTIEREWRGQSIVLLEIDMPVRALVSRPEIAANKGQVALARGPLVYCVEQDDCPFPLDELHIAAGARSVAAATKVERLPDFLGGVCVLRVPALRCAPPKAVSPGTSARETAAREIAPAYFEPPKGRRRVTVTMIPYYARANRSAHSEWVTLLPVALG